MQGKLQRGWNVLVQQLSRRLRRLGKHEIEGGRAIVEISADGAPELIFQRLERILRLDYLQLALRHSGFRAIDVQRRQCAQLQRALVALVRFLRQTKRLLRHCKALLRLHQGPVLINHAQDRVVQLRQERGA